MQKIPTIYLRDPDTKLRYVSREQHPDCGWVFAGEGVATRKYDGTCMMYDGQAWWARREVGPNRPTPAGFVPIETDEVTGKAVGWEPVAQSAYAKYHAMAIDDEVYIDWPIGTYELVGPKVNGNPEDVDRHLLWSHAAAEELPDAPRDYDGLAAYLGTFPGEGIVWHHPDGRMAKVKRKDFPAEAGL